MKNVKNTEKSAITMSLAFLLFSMIVPTFLLDNVNAVDQQALDVQHGPDGNWYKIQTDLITILFPAEGKKPMFLWWYTNDTDNIYVVKYKGLIEYMTLNHQHYLHRYRADGLTIRERLEARYGMSGDYQVQIRNKIRNHLGSLSGLHPAFLPFNACQWDLAGPDVVSREDGVSYVSFNFTLVTAPPPFAFANGNVVIRCRFYATDATESVYGLYDYSAKAGELKMDIVLKQWEWNVDKLKELFSELKAPPFNFIVPDMRAGLALWTDLASIRITGIPIDELDALPSDLLDAHYSTSDLIVGNQRVNVQINMTAQGADETPLSIRSRLRERFRLRFARESRTLAGFFDFVDTAVIIDSTDSENKTLVDVTASYIAAGNHMRLFIGYPYFGSNILEHDPTIGVESIVRWLPVDLLFVLIASTLVIAAAVAAVKMRKKTVNIVSVR